MNYKGDKSNTALQEMITNIAIYYKRIVIQIGKCLTTRNFLKAKIFL